MSSEITTPSERVIDYARSAWGDEYTKAIFGKIIASIHNANSLIQPIDYVDRFKLQIADIPTTRNGVKTARLVGLHSYWSGFDLLMDRQNPQAVLDESEVTVFHETARVRIFQQRITDGSYKDNTELDTIGILAEDGMVLSAVETLLGKDAFDLDKYLSYDVSESAILTHIESSLKATLQTGDNHFDIHMGTKELPRIGYKVGHAVVKSAMTEYGLTLDGMFRQTPKFYEEHAKKMISK
jgi:hypothetical protein